MDMSMHALMVIGILLGMSSHLVFLVATIIMMLLLILLFLLIWIALLVRSIVHRKCLGGISARKTAAAMKQDCYGNGKRKECSNYNTRNGSFFQFVIIIITRRIFRCLVLISEERILIQNRMTRGCENRFALSNGHQQHHHHHHHRFTLSNQILLTNVDSKHEWYAPMLGQ